MGWQLVQDMAQQIRRIANAVEAYMAAQGSNKDMGNVTIYNGGCGDGGLLSSEIKHYAIDMTIPDDTSVAGLTIITPPTGKYIAILGGRVGSATKARVSLLSATTLLDLAFTPENSFVLPPTTVNMPHYVTAVDTGLILQVQALAAKGSGEQTRYLTGFLKYIEVEAV
jgi:hypothetical protein